MLARTMRQLGLLTAEAAAAGLAAVLLAASPASAHVTVNPNQAVQGGFAKLAFRVPNESDTASTVKLEVILPTQAPIAFLSLKPVAGWTATVEKTKLARPIKSDDGEVSEAVSKITWMSAGADSAIRVGQFQEFEVSAGPLPEVDQIAFPASVTLAANRSENTSNSWALGLGIAALVAALAALVVAIMAWRRLTRPTVS